MEASFNSQFATLIGYLGVMGIWAIVSRRFPALWIPTRKAKFARPWVELGWAALAVLGVIVMSALFSFGIRIPLPEEAGPLRDLLFLLNVAAIWSPMALMMWFRKQGLETCLMWSPGLVKRVAWGVVMAVLGSVLYVLVSNDGSLADLGGLLAELRWMSAMQGLIQFFGFGYLLYRLAAVGGWRVASVVVGLLYGLVKFPYYIGQLGMGFTEASGLIALAIVVATGGLMIVGKQGDLMAPALLHTLMDAVQKL